MLSHTTILYGEILKTFFKFSMLGLCTANLPICIRDATEVKNKFESVQQITTTPQLGHEDPYFLTMLADSTTFVDKTLLIKEILDIDRKLILINGPPKTGKSVNLNMLKAFFELRTLKPNGTVHPASQTSTYKFFTTGHLDTSSDGPLQTPLSSLSSMESNQVATKATYGAPAISKYKPLIDEHLAQYPVIHLEFSPAPGLNLTHSIRKRICEPFIKHNFPHFAGLHILDNNHTSDETKQLVIEQLYNFTYYEDSCSHDKPLGSYEIETSAFFLSELMYKLLGKPVVILVDDYITLLADYVLDKDARDRPQPDPELENCLKLLKNFLAKTFVDNPYLKKAVLTGSVPMETSLFDHYPQFARYDVADNHLQAYYGVTDTELDALFRRFGIASESAKKARQFYNGYASRPNVNLTVYNVWSIVNFLNEKQIDNYWVEHKETFNELVRWIDRDQFASLLSSFVNGNDKAISFKRTDFQTADALLAIESNYTESHVDQVLSLLWEMGFLTYSHHPHLGDRVHVRLPNEEIRTKVSDVLEN